VGGEGDIHSEIFLCGPAPLKINEKDPL
jgi:hypothetical protein